MFTQRLLQKFGLIALLLLLNACGNKDLHIIQTQGGSEEDADQLLIVDCLLPGKIKKLGRGTTFVTPRQPAKLSAKDCQSRGGEYVSHEQANSASALKVWLSAAQEGDVIAQTYVGEIYEKGSGITPDYQTAAAWYKKAADKGYARAKLNLGYLYEKGLGLQKNLKTALQLYRDASGLGDTDVEYVAHVDPTDNSQNEQLSLLKNELEQERNHLKNAQEQLNTKSVTLDSEKQKLTQFELSLNDERAQLDKQRKIAKNDKRKIDGLETQLKKREQELEQRRQQTLSLNDDLLAFRQQIKTMGTGHLKVTVAGPNIQMVKPPLIATRGIAAVNFRPETKTSEIVGRVTAPAGLEKLMINDKIQPLDASGVFRILISMQQERVPIHIMAIDQQGKRAELEFEFIQGTKPSTPGKLPTSEISKDTAGEIGNFHALLIGNNEYQHYPKLNTAENDVRKIEQIMREHYGFKTTTLINANRFTILAALNRLNQKLTKKDNLLIYYAGHGELNQDKVTGYWIPVNASRDNKRNWISNAAITDILNVMEVKRVLVVADSCYSGTLTQSAIANVDASVSQDTRMAWLKSMAKTKARTALTSGGLKPVADAGGGDHSVFAQAFIEVLEANQMIIEGQRLHKAIQARMTLSPIAKTTGQIPEYSPIKHAGHETGEFFFLPSIRS